MQASALITLLARDSDDGETAGSPDAAQDLYGLGVRIGFYLQAMGMILYNYGSRKDCGKGLKLASGSISIAILASWFVFAARGLFSPSEAAVVLLILISLSYPAKTTLLNPHTIAGEATGLVALLLVEMGTCAALLWLFASLVVTLPHLGTDNVVFFFAQVRLDGWFRWVALVYSVIDTATSFSLAYKIVRLIKVALQKEKGSDAHGHATKIEAITEWRKLAVWIKCLHWLLWVFVVIAVELTVHWNHLVPSTNLQSPGQLIPLVAGIIIFADSLHVAGREQLPGAYTRVKSALGPSLLDHLLRPFRKTLYFAMHLTRRSRVPQGTGPNPRPSIDERTSTGLQPTNPINMEATLGTITGPAPEP